MWQRMLQVGSGGSSTPINIETFRVTVNSVSSYNGGDSRFVGSMSTDNNYQTAWLGTSSASQDYIIYELPNTAMITNIIVCPATPGASAVSAEFSSYISDSTTFGSTAENTVSGSWTNVWNDQSLTTTIDLSPSSAKKGKYVKILVKNGWIGVGEITIKGYEL